MQPPVWDRLGIPKPPGWSEPFRSKSTYAGRYKRPLVYRSDWSGTPWTVHIPPSMHAWGQDVKRGHRTHDDAIAYAHQYATDYHHGRSEPCS